MDLTRELKARDPFSPKLHRDLADKVLEAERSLIELAKEMGISVQALRKWSRKVEKAEDQSALETRDTLVPSTRVKELEKEIAELKTLLERQSVQIQILKKNGAL